MVDHPEQASVWSIIMLSLVVMWYARRLDIIKTYEENYKHKLRLEMYAGRPYIYLYIYIYISQHIHIYKA